jgi:hypothetical protein
MNAVDRLEALRPTEESVDRMWSPGERRAALTRVLRPAPARPHRARRPLMLAVAAASVAVVGLAVSLVLPSGAPGGASPAAAAELDRLAGIAAAAPFDVAGPGRFLHMVIVETQTSSGAAAENPVGTSVHSMESWSAHDGSTWRRDTLAGRTMYFRFGPDGNFATDGSADVLSPAYLASLPTDANALRTYLRSHVTGSTSTDEAVFSAVGEMLRRGFAPPALRVAAIDVLKHTAHVELGAATADQLGRPVIELDFVDQRNRPDEVQALYFSTSTAEILQETDRWPGMDFQSVVQSTGVVDAVPDEVLSLNLAPGDIVTK